MFPQNRIASYRQGDGLFSTACSASLIAEGNTYVIHAEKLTSRPTRSLTPALASVCGAGSDSVCWQRRKGILNITLLQTRGSETGTPPLQGWSQHTEVTFLSNFILLSWIWGSRLPYWIYKVCVKQILMCAPIPADSILLTVATLVQDQWQTEILLKLPERRFHSERLQKPGCCSYLTARVLFSLRRRRVELGGLHSHIVLPGAWMVYL